MTKHGAATVHVNMQAPEIVKRIQEEMMRSFEFLREETVRGLKCGLASVLSDLSERHMSAMWMIDLEHVIWCALCPEAPRPKVMPLGFEAFVLTSEQQVLLGALSSACGGWVSWVSDIVDESGAVRVSAKDLVMGCGYSAVRFVDLMEWTELHARWARTRGA